MTREIALQRLARRQHGVATRTQLRSLGFTAHEIAGRARRQSWRRIAPSVFEIVPGSTDPLRALTACVLSSGGAASHRSAGALLGALEVHPARPEIVIADGRYLDALDAVVHRSRDRGSRGRTTVQGISCTSATRTLVDLAGILGPVALDDAIARLLRARRTTARRLSEAVAPGQRGRHGIAEMRDALDRLRKQDRETESLLEILVLQAVQDGHLPQPTAQFAVRVGANDYRLDIAWPEAKVFVEADGLASRIERSRVITDRRRQNQLVVAGWVPLRYTWDDATTRVGVIVREIRAMLAARGLR